MARKQPKREVVDVHEEAFFAVENRITLEKLRDLIRAFGNDRETLASAVQNGGVASARTVRGLTGPIPSHRGGNERH